MKNKKLNIIFSNIYPKQLFLKNEHSKLLKGLETKEKAGISQPAVCIGEPDSMKTAQKTVININFFLEHRSEILALKEQVQMIRSFLHA